MFPVGKVMESLHQVRGVLLDYEMYSQTQCLDILIESANRAGHEVYTLPECVSRVEHALSRLDEVDPHVRELVLFELHRL